jgi:hypothetical protein
MNRCLFRLGATALVTCLSLTLSPAAARADVSKDQCIASNGKAQDFRRDRKLSLAREQLRVCSDPSCPAIVRSDCIKRLDDLEAAQPTVVFDVKDATGSDVTAVKVTLDGQPLTTRLDGTAYKLDPGPHNATFEIAGLAPVTRALVIGEGDKGRHERVAFTAPGAAPAVSITPAAVAPAAPTGPVTPAPPAASATTEGGMGTKKVLGLVSGGVGIVGLVVGGIFGGLTLSEKSDVTKYCATTCQLANYNLAQSAHSSAVTDGAVSTAGLIAGGVLLAGGATLFFTAKSPTATATGTLVTPSVGPGGGGLLVKGTF